MERIGIALLGVLVVAIAADHAAAADLKAGVARIDLTPPLSMKATLGGYGARMNRPAVGVHDRVWAKALFLTDGSKRFVLITADVLGFPPAFRLALLKALEPAGWQSDQILMLPSHSHASIEMNAINPKNVLKIPQIGLFQQELYDLTLANLVKLISEAAEKAEPIAVGTSSAQIKGWHHNRRRGNTLTDDELTVTRIDTTAGKPLAVLVNWTAHPTFMDDVDMMFSGGWPGQMQRTLEALIGDGETAMYYNGAEGDQSPAARQGSGSSDWEKAERYGRELGIVVWRQWQKTKTSPSVAFGFAQERVKLPKTSYHPDFMETGGKEYGLNKEVMDMILAVLMTPTTSIDYLRLGDLLIVGIPGEMATGLGMQIKNEIRKQTGIAHPVIGGLANEWISYILSADEYTKGGYEASVSFYGPTLGKTLVEAAIRGAASMKQ